MSAEQNKPERSFKEVVQEFSNTCAKAGKLQYEIKLLEHDLENVNNELRKLDLEAMAASAKEKNKQAEENKKDEVK